MADMVELFVLLLGLLAVPFYITCLGEFRTFPFFPHTQKNEINTAHYMRVVSVLATGISASYGFALFGHMIGFGGFETMFTTQRLLFFLIFGFVAIMFAIRSKQLDNLIYKEIQDYDNLQDEMFKVARKKIRSENRVRKMLERTTAEKTARAEKEKQRLEKDIKKNYEMERQLAEKDRELALLKKRLGEVEKVKQKTQIGIDMTSNQIEATDKQITRLEIETNELGSKLGELKTTLDASLARLAPLLEESQRKGKELDRTDKEFQKIAKRIPETKRAIETLSTKIKHTQAQTKVAQEEVKNLDEVSVESERKLTAVQKQLDSLSKQKNNILKIINDKNIQRLSAEDEIIEIEVARKRIEKYVDDESSQEGGKIFE